MEDSSSSKATFIVIFCILTLVICKSLFELYVSMRQIKVYRSVESVPRDIGIRISEETFQKSRRYGLEREAFNCFEASVFATESCFELALGTMATIWHGSMSMVERLSWSSENEIIVSCMFVLLSGIISYFRNLPFEVYNIFFLEQQHGFNQQTAGFFALDQIKSTIIEQIVAIPLTAAVVYLMRFGNDMFFVRLWLLTCGASLLYMAIHPILIAPLFDKYTALGEGDLRKSIEELAASLHFPLSKIYVVEESKRSSHSNAYFYGFWNSKRIVLSDTLLPKDDKPNEPRRNKKGKRNGCSVDEVLAVIAHELGHWKLGHVTKMTILMQIHFLLTFMIFAFCFEYGPFYEAAGFAPGMKPSLVGLYIVSTYIMLPYNSAVNFATNVVSRCFEYQADEFAHSLGYSSQLRSALIKLNADNLEFPIYDSLFSAWNHSHPTLMQRLSRLKELDEVARLL